MQGLVDKTVHTKEETASSEDNLHSATTVIDQWSVNDQLNSSDTFCMHICQSKLFGPDRRPGSFS